MQPGSVPTQQTGRPTAAPKSPLNSFMHVADADFSHSPPARLVHPILLTVGSVKNIMQRRSFVASTGSVIAHDA